MATKEVKTYTLAGMKDKYIGKVGTAERDDYEYNVILLRNNWEH